MVQPVSTDVATAIAEPRAMVIESKGHIGWKSNSSGAVANFCTVPADKKLKSRWLSLQSMARTRYRRKHTQLSDEECMEKYDHECE